jgi:hypothetical protein
MTPSDRLPRPTCEPEFPVDTLHIEMPEARKTLPFNAQQREAFFDRFSPFLGRESSMCVIRGFTDVPLRVNQVAAGLG